MSTLYLVRHGQASFLSDDYDVLSAKGLEQSRAIGRHWAERGLALDALYIGPQRRHAQTADAMREGAEAAGVALPAPKILDGAAEIDVQSLMTEASTRVSKMFPDLPLAMGSENDDGRRARRHFTGVFFKLMEGWARGEQRFAGLETCDDFSQRVNGALATLMREQGRGKRVALVSSGGPVSQTIRLALKLPSDALIALMPALYNASISELRFTEDRLSLIAMNGYAHLPSSLITTI